MIYRNATIDDIEAVARLQQKYHVSTIDEKDKKGAGSGMGGVGQGVGM